MVTQVSARNACWLDGIAVAGQDLRLASAGMLTPTGSTGSTGITATQGVRLVGASGAGQSLNCIWTSGMSFNLSAGVCYVQGTASATAGMYELILDTTTLLTCTASDPTNPRIDSVIAVVVDNGNNTSTAVFKILAGTPAGSPVAPTLPANSLLLATIAVGASVSTLSSGNFTDKRVWTVCNGGILPVASTNGVTINGGGAQYVHDISTGRLKILSGGTAYAPLTTAFAPVSTTVPGSVTVASGGATATVGSISITTDGATEVELVATYEGFQAATPAVGIAVQAYLTLDGTQVSNAGTAVWDSTDFHERGAGMVRTWVTPSAGTHTVALVISQYGVGGSNVTISNGSAPHAALIRAHPAAN